MTHPPLRVVVAVLFAAGIGGSRPSARADDLPERANLARKRVEANAGVILVFAYPSEAGAEISKAAVKFDGYRKLADGFELTYTFRWDVPSGTRKDSHLTLAFLFDADGRSDGVLVKEADVYRPTKDAAKSRYVVRGIVRPFFNDVTDLWDELDPLRDKLREHPKVKDDRKHLRAVETASARELCELWLRLEFAK
jgi:hypothetical protein